MILWLFDVLIDISDIFHVFGYISTRAIFAAMTALIISLVIGPSIINSLNYFKLSQPIRSDGPESHGGKLGTPTMGGFLILIALILSVFLWGNLANTYMQIALTTLIGLGLIGMLDDTYKIKRGKGIKARNKFILQCVLATGVIFWLYSYTGQEITSLSIPFAKNAFLGLSWLFFPFAFCVIIGASNATNLTDGLDGLAIMPISLISVALGIIVYCTGNYQIADYLQLNYVENSGELTVFCAAMVGACLGFLWFNTYPAQVFMGDIGSLSLGGTLGIIALIARHEIVFFIMSGVFVVEALSVILQVGSYKLRGKRIFRMAPLHHHYELKGMPEPKIIVRFWIITIVLVLIGLATLKLR